MNNTDTFIWTPEKLSEYYNWCDTVKSNPSLDSMERFKEQVMEQSSPTLSDSIVEAITALNYNDGNNNIRTYDFASTICSFKDKREWIERRMKTGATIYRVTNGTDSFQCEEKTKNGTIKSFEIQSSDFFIAWYKEGGFEQIKHLRKVSKPILVTEDGIVTDGEQIVYGVISYDDGLLVVWIKAKRSITDSNDYIKVFTTESAAKEYITLHSKSLSLADVEKAIDTLNMGRWRANIKSELLNALKQSKQ